MRTTVSGVVQETGGWLQP